MNNTSNGYGPGAVAHSNRWEIFDRLPKEVRDFLNYAPFNFAVEPLIERNINSHGVEKVIKCTNELIEDKKRRDLRLVWNIRE